MNEYKIQFSGLAEGLHEFSYLLEKPFFDHFEDEVISDGAVAVSLAMDRQSRMLQFSFRISGTVEVVCDRCADPLSIAIEGNEHLIARMGEESDTEDDNIVFLPDEAFEFDLTPHLFDYIHLMLPMRLTHDNSSDGRSCDPEMLKLIERYSSASKVDSRWEGLTGLIIHDQDTKEKKSKE